MMKVIFLRHILAAAIKYFCYFRQTKQITFFTLLTVNFNFIPDLIHSFFRLPHTHSTSSSLSSVCSGRVIRLR